MVHNILNNGLSVLFHKMPNTHSVTVGLYVRAGVGYKTERVVGITHFLEHLHFRRAGKMSQSDLYYEMERIGSTLRATTYRDFVKFTMKVAPENFTKSIQIFCSLLETYQWTNEEFEKEKDIVINQILEKGNYISVDQSVREVVFREHYLANEIMGDIFDIKEITLADIWDYKKEIFSTNNLLLCITGNIHEMEYDKAIEKLQRLSLSNSGYKNFLEYPICFHNRKPDIVFVPVQDENLLDVNISFDVKYDENSKDKLTILNCILGEGVGSKLQRLIREEKSYTSNISSYVEWYKDFAILHIYFSVDKKKLSACFDAVVQVLKDMKYSIKKRDLDVSLPFYTVNQVFYEDDTEEMNFQLAYNNFILETKFSTIQLKNSLKTIDVLQQYAGEIFTLNNMSVVIIGNTRGVTKKLIKEKFKEILTGAE